MCPDGQIQQVNRKQHLKTFKLHLCYINFLLFIRLQFRTLVRRYGCDICFTPMILADSFVQSSKARDNEFTTYKGDEPLIVQFAAKTVNDFVGASVMVAP